MSLIASLLALLVVLSVAVRPRGRLPEWTVAITALAVLLVLGATGARAALDAVVRLAPTVAFLAALLVISEGCRREGLFDAAGALVRRRAAGNPVTLLGGVFVLATAVTIVLGLDATVVLVTPVVMLSTAGLGGAAMPYLYACVQLANAGSLLLPVSNLTNLLAFHSSGLSFMRFAALMALPTIAVVAVEWVCLRHRLSADPVPLHQPDPTPDPAPGPGSSPGGAPTGQGFALGVIAVTLIGFALSSLLGVNPVWVAVAGALVLTTPALLSARLSPAELLGSLKPGFLSFVLALGAIVQAAANAGLASAVHSIFPAGASLPALLGIAAFAALLANLVNNLPATLILLPGAAAAGTGPLLAMLIGVNVGPNLTPTGSLATLLWRRVLVEHGIRPPLREFVTVGLLTTVPALTLATCLLWIGLRV